MKLSTIFAAFLLIALVAGAVMYFQDTDGPVVTLSPASGPVSAKRILALEIADPDSGLKQVEVTVRQGETSSPLFSQSFAPGTPSLKEELSLEKAGLKNGPMEIQVKTVDNSIYHFGSGNATEQSFALEYDSRPPVVSVLSGAHNFTQGGSGLVVYTLSEEVEKTGVEVGDRFFPAFRQDSGRYVSLFAFPYDLETKSFVPKVVAVDAAGNERRAGFYYHANGHAFRKRRINISDTFLNAKTPEFQELAPGVTEPLEIFLAVNRELRVKNRAALAEFASQSAPRALWEGAFLRQPNAATLALFGDDRTYYYKDKKVDHQRHLGYDLASTAQAEVPAANSGNVVFADYLGIYGLCVVIDHGLGLQTLYGHLSRIDVQSGESVTRGQTIGRTGATGMAGGDHLHYGVILAGLPVSPVEWWDGTWMKNNIDGKLELAAEGSSE